MNKFEAGNLMFAVVIFSELHSEKFLYLLFLLSVTFVKKLRVTAHDVRVKESARENIDVQK